MIFCADDPFLIGGQRDRHRADIAVLLEGLDGKAPARLAQAMADFAGSRAADGALGRNELLAGRLFDQLHDQAGGQHQEVAQLRGLADVGCVHRLDHELQELAGRYAGIRQAAGRFRLGAEGHVDVVLGRHTHGYKVLAKGAALELLAREGKSDIGLGRQAAGHQKRADFA